MANRTTLTTEKREAFLALVRSNGGNVTAAAVKVRVSRDTLYRHRDEDKEFARAWDLAVQEGTDALEDEALRRAHDGVVKPVYQGGKKVGSVREYSDTLLIFMLKARRPDKFKERSAVEHTVTLGLADRLAAARRRVNGDGEDGGQGS